MFIKFQGFIVVWWYVDLANYWEHRADRRFIHEASENTSVSGACKDTQVVVNTAQSV
jgi:hypothetical protein